MQAVVAVYDACVLHPAFLRDLLVRLAIFGRRTGWLRANGRAAFIASGFAPCDGENRIFPLRLCAVQPNLWTSTSAAAVCAATSDGSSG
jgi:hypothetical protein